MLVAVTVQIAALALVAGVGILCAAAYRRAGSRRED